ncbi:MAG: peptidase M16 [Acidobacteria bacterium RIFCSPLOWO2_12_FULL_66_10]|nr:MAG: peptidase M16 [Acidobacteria bacterium RIFCSPLOWO2_12_FULL_66_10]
MSDSPIVRDVLDNGLRILTERMTQVRSISIGVWLTRGSRHESAERGGIAHFVEHMLFKGTASRTAEDIAQAIDSIGGQLDAFTAKEYASYYIKVLDEHLPLAMDILADIVRNPAFSPEDVEREKKVVVEEIKMVEDTPDDLVHELFTQGFWENHPLGRPILGTKDTVESFGADGLRGYFSNVYTAKNLIVSAVGNLEHDRVRDLVAKKFGSLTQPGDPAQDEAPSVTPKILIRNKELEQSHLCVGVSSYPQSHDDRYASYVLNTLLGGSMSSRLFQNVREKRGLAYAVFSGLSAYRDAGSFTIYAGCSNDAVGEVLDLVVEELRGVKNSTVPDAELRRSKDHLKGSLMLSLENTASRMSHLARQEIYFDRQCGLDETLSGIEQVTADDVRRVAADLFRNDSLSATVLGSVNGLTIPRERLGLD